MPNKKTKAQPKYTAEQIKAIIAEMFVELADELKDPSLIIAGMLAMELLDKKLK